jgi:hypothetical protein
VLVIEVEKAPKKARVSGGLSSEPIYLGKVSLGKPAIIRSSSQLRGSTGGRCMKPVYRYSLVVQYFGHVLPPLLFYAGVPDNQVNPEVLIG